MTITEALMNLQRAISEQAPNDTGSHVILSLPTWGRLVAEKRSIDATMGVVDSDLPKRLEVCGIGKSTLAVESFRAHETMLKAARQEALSDAANAVERFAKLLKDADPAGPWGAVYTAVGKVRDLMETP